MGIGKKAKSISREYSVSLTEGVIWKQLLRFFVPLLFASLFQQLYTTVNAVIVGQFVGKEALAAIDSTASLLRLFINLFTGISTGATILVSQQYGAGKIEDIEKCVHSSASFSVLGGAIMAIAGFLLAGTGVRLMDVPLEIQGQAQTYLRVYFIGMLPAMVYNMGAGILRAVGDSKRPLYFLIVSSFVNVGLDYLFVAGLHMGVAGAALATVLAQGVSAVLVFLALSKAEGAYRLKWRKIRFELPVVKQILKIGLPIGLQSAMYPLSSMMVQSSINRLGTDTIAAWGICGKLDFPFWMVVGSFSTTISTFVAQNYGAKLYDRVRGGVRSTLFMALAIVLPFSAVLYIFATPLSGLFVSDQAVIAQSASLLRFYTPFFFSYIFSDVFAGAIRGTGETLRPMILTLIGTCALRILWVLFVVPLSPNIKTIITAFPLAWVITSLAFIVYYLRYMRKALPRTVAANEPGI